MESQPPEITHLFFGQALMNKYAPLVSRPSERKGAIATANWRRVQYEHGRPFDLCAKLLMRRLRGALSVRQIREGGLKSIRLIGVRLTVR
jgi:hypothetical protein